MARQRSHSIEFKGRSRRSSLPGRACTRFPSGMISQLLINPAKATNADPWVIGLRQRRPSLVVAVALANKTARIAWAVMHRHENYQRVAAAA